MVSFFLRPLPPYPSQESPFQHPPPPSSRCMWHSVSKHEKHEYEVVCSNHPIKYWMLEPTVSDQNYFKLFVNYLRDFLPTFLAISWKYTNSISGLNTLFWFQLFCSKLFSCFLYLVKRQFNFFFILALRDFFWNLRDYWKCLTIILSYETFLTFEYAKISQFCHFFTTILIIQGEGVNSMFVNF